MSLLPLRNFRRFIAPDLVGQWAEQFTKLLRCNRLFSPSSKPLWIAREVPPSEIRDRVLVVADLIGDSVHGKPLAHSGAHLEWKACANFSLYAYMSDCTVGSHVEWSFRAC